jgi:D-methionine transport system ATP-binding protein
VLLCDEATSALDPASTAGILDLLRQVRAELGLTVLLITHEMSVVRAVCDSAVLMSAGRVVDGGPLTEVLGRPDSALAAQLVPTPPLPEPGSGDLLQLTVTDAGPQGAVLHALAAELGLSVEVVAGSVETMAGRRFGRLLLRVEGDDGRLDPALARLRAGGALVERAPAIPPVPLPETHPAADGDLDGAAVPDLQRIADAPEVQR